MEFVSIESPLPGMQLWGSEDSERSYCITFDNSYPDLGYRASWINMDGSMSRSRILDEKFDRFEQASAALAAIQKTKQN